MSLIINYHNILHSNKMAEHNGHFSLGDSHHTTIDVNPTHIDSHNVCGHVGVNTDINSHVTVGVGGSGCISTTGGGLHTSSMSGGVEVSIHW